MGVTRSDAISSSGATLVPPDESPRAPAGVCAVWMIPACALLTRRVGRANGCEWDSRTCREAARAGHLHIIPWARANGCDWDFSTCSAAAGAGQLPMLQVGCVNRYFQLVLALNWHPTDTRVTSQWLRANRCDWNSYTCAAVCSSP
jgi:hypothetical protein